MLRSPLRRLGFDGDPHEDRAAAPAVRAERVGRGFKAGIRGAHRGTNRETADRYALVETEVELAVKLEPEPEPDPLAELLALAERDCFIGSSLTAKPSYRWVVNGRTIDS